MKSKLSAILAEVQTTGEPIAITRHGRIIAEVHAHRPVQVTPKRGCLKSAAFSISEDFDAEETGFEDFFGDSTATEG